MHFPDDWSAEGLCTCSFTQMTWFIIFWAYEQSQIPKEVSSLTTAKENCGDSKPEA